MTTAGATVANPRVNSALLQKNVGRIVRIAGRVLSVSPSGTLLQATDQGQVQIKSINGSKIRPGIVEVMGRVEPDLTIHELDATLFADDFDMDLYNTMIKNASEMDDLFGWN